MNFLRFLFSKVFLKQLTLAASALSVLVFLSLLWLNSYTNHGDFETVPNLLGKSYEVAQIELKAKRLNSVIQDTTNYNPKYPKGAIIEQNPLAGSQVKEARKIYVSLNPIGYRRIPVPNVVRKTFRQAKSTLEAAGFFVGELSYEDDLGKEEVLELRFNDQTVSIGTKLEKTSRIDLVLGNGNPKTN